MAGYSNIRIVLVETSHPGNIGAVARAMKNMGLARLYLVNPDQYPDPKATARAASALDVLGQAVVCSDLAEAIADCQLVVGASARNRAIPWPVMNPREAAADIGREPESHEIALLFGREDRGLTNEELRLCQYHLHIPSNPEYSSLNLAAAVQVVCYELRMALEAETLAQAGWDWGTEWDEPAANAAELERFYVHLEETLIELGCINPQSPRQFMTRMKRLFQRARPGQTEVNLLRGILTAAQKAVEVKRSQ